MHVRPFPGKAHRRSRSIETLGSGSLSASEAYRAELERIGSLGSPSQATTTRSDTGSGGTLSPPASRRSSLTPPPAAAAVSPAPGEPLQQQQQRRRSSLGTAAGPQQQQQLQAGASAQAFPVPSPVRPVPPQPGRLRQV